MLARFEPLLLLILAAACTTPEPDPRVGELAGGGHVLATEQVVHPAGTTTVLDGRPLDLALELQTLFVKEQGSVLAFDTRTGEITSRLALKDGCSMHGLAVRGGHVYATGTNNALFELSSVPPGDLRVLRTITLPGEEPYPCGIALTPDGSHALVCLSRENTLALVDLVSGATQVQIPVGVAPYDVVVTTDGRTAFVSNLGGRRVLPGEPSANSSGTPIVVDERGIGTSGTVTRVDLQARAASGELECGPHPTALALSADGARLFVAATSSDAVLVVDTGRFEVVERIDVKPEAALGFGSLPNALALSPDGRTLYVANGGNNAVAVVRLADGPNTTSRVAGFVPTGWFPGALAARPDELFIANVKGTGARKRDEKQQAFKAPRDRGSLSRVAVPDEAELARLTRQALRDTRVPEALREDAARPRVGIEPVPIPERAGEPSTIRHVVYVIKENRTYDQVLGDLPRGNGEARLCTFGREVTPNHHALAEQFVQLDNYYCNGVVSADGHQWATQAISVEYLEKQFGGWTRSYDLGTDALTYAPSGFLWDAVLGRGLTFRNWGEFDLSVIDAPRGDWFEVQRAARAGELRWHAAMPQAQLARFSAPDYPGWELRISDQYRVDRFLEALARMETSGEFPSLAIVYLPQDHTSGTKESAPTPRACVADNDLALGRLVEALSKSRFWPQMAIFVNEDDPQDGWDHVDGHRSLCLVASPWAKRGALVSRFYDQTSVLRTIERILGLPSLTQRDAGSPVMSECFTRASDLRPYAALQNRIPLDERNPKKTAGAREFDLRAPDRIDDDAFNRVIWSSVRGDEPYPAAFAGAHGRGLAALGLKLGAADEDDDD